MREDNQPSPVETQISESHGIVDAPSLVDVMAAARLLRPAIIAIDGPAASGKSTVGFDLAQTLGYLFFDTGVMYRAVTHAGLARGLDVEDPALMGDLAEVLEIDILPPGPEAENGLHCVVLVDGVDVSPAIRGGEVERAVSTVSSHSRVRVALSDHQRRIGMRYGRGDAEKPGVVMVGRDIGTVVIPNAPLKIFMDATAEERARRRYNEARAKGKDVAFEDVRNDVLRRDRLDSARALSPLRAADDSIVIDTSHFTPEQVLNRILALLVVRALGKAPG